MEMTDAREAPPPLTLRGIRAGFGQREVLAETSLTFEGGSYTALVGPSGSGKTTLLRVIAGLHRPRTGRLAWGQEVWHEGAGERLAPERRGIGLLAQKPGLWPHLTAEAHLRLVLRWAGVEKRQLRERAAALLDTVGLTDRARHRPGELSGGEAQRLALARALTGRPRLLLLDEPFSSMDVPLRRSLCEVVFRLARVRRLTVIHVTHEPDEALLHPDRLVELDGGRVAFDGPPRQAGEDSTPRTAFLRAFTARVS